MDGRIGLNVTSSSSKIMWIASGQRGRWWPGEQRAPVTSRARGGGGGRENGGRETCAVLI